MGNQPPVLRLYFKDNTTIMLVNRNNQNYYIHAKNVKLTLSLLGVLQVYESESLVVRLTPSIVHVSSPNDDFSRTHFLRHLVACLTKASTLQGMTSGQRGRHNGTLAGVQCPDFVQQSAAGFVSPSSLPVVATVAAVFCRLGVDNLPNLPVSSVVDLIGPSHWAWTGHTTPISRHRIDTFVVVLVVTR